MAKIKLRRDTSTNWQSINPVLLAGEIGIVTDSTPKKIKIGDGSKVWNSLDYAILSDNSVSTSNILDDAVTEEKLASNVRTKLNTSSTGSTSAGYTDPITATTYTLSASDKGKTLNLQNESDLTITIPSGLTNLDFTYDKVSGNGQVFFEPASGVTITGDYNFVKTDGSGNAIGGFRTVSSDTYAIIPSSDIEVNTAPVSNSPTINNTEEGQTATISANITDAESDTLDTHEFRFYRYDNNAGSPDLGTETLVSSSQTWDIPASGFTDYHFKGSVLPKATSGVKTGVWTDTPFYQITAAPVSNLWTPAADSASAITQFWVSSLDVPYSNTGATISSAIDDPVNGVIRAVKDKISGFTGTEQDNYGFYQTVEGSPAYVFTGQTQFNFGNILDSVVNQQSSGDTWAVTVLGRLFSTDIGTNYLLSKKASDQGMTIRFNGNRRKIQLADNEAGDFGRQTGGFDNVIGNYITTFWFEPGAASASDRCKFYDASDLQINNPGGAPEGSGLSAGNAGSLLLGGLGDVNYALYEIVISKNPTLDYIQRCESAFVYRHGLENSIIYNSAGTGVGTGTVGSLSATNPYDSAAPTLS